MSWDDLSGAGVTVSTSPHDSARFGRVVIRVVVGSQVHEVDAVSGPVLEALSRPDVDLAVVRWPAALTGLGAHLAAAGHRVVPADTLVYWAGGPTAEGPAPLDLASLSDVPAEPAALEELVRATFEGYVSHYAASPDLDPAAVTEGYVEWALRTAAAEPHSTWVAREGGDLAAFATTRALADPRDVEVELAGTSPRHRGRGVYGALFTSLLARLLEQGHDRLLISTQAGNVAVQRLWARAGMLPVAAFTTVHVRPSG
ncbi:GNAT family N-acetyltransferase [Oryzobacter terrae]|uniref:GNAT family N-acetyltransferase n=1 Tax=Oryzobacter terrae TaxID=1620385 RepID=UPI00366AD026